MTIPDAVFDHFSADPGGPLLNLGFEADDPDSPIRSAIEEFLSCIDERRVAQVRDSRDFQCRMSAKTNHDREARIWIAQDILASRIAASRLEMLRQDAAVDCPKPYDHPALADLTPDEDYLVPLRDFEFDGSRLLRNGHAFLVMSTTGSPNSTYWLLQSCFTEGLREHVKVRLDPFLYGSAESFHARAYLMLVYGQPLDWHRIDGLRESEHGRWRPDRASGHPSEFTDFVWTPRGSEVHFVCEEVPTIESSGRVGGRYLHAIYQPSEVAISHFDLAVRIYEHPEIVARHDRHVRHTGKAGLRKKVLRIDELVPRTAFSSVCQSFFVWNHDVRRYFEDGCN